MSNTQTSGYCHYCEDRVLAVRQKPNHILHLILTVLTIGFWLPVWLIVTLISLSRPYRCVACGSAV